MAILTLAAKTKSSIYVDYDLGINSGELLKVFDEDDYINNLNDWD